MTRDVYQAFLDETDDMAAYWAVRLASPDCTPEDRYAFEKWRDEDPAHGQAYDAMLKGNGFVDRNMTDPLFQALIEEARAETEPPLWRRPAVRAGAIAAAVLIAVMVPALVFIGIGRAPAPPAATAQAEFYETAVGERSTVSLADGSVVTLNTASRIEVDFRSARRTVILSRGQGYFEVAEDHDRPFTVEAGGRRVTALGTAFAVRLDGARTVEVVLVEGVVEVAAVTGPSTDGSAGGPAASPITLRAGERLVARRHGRPEVAPATIDEQTSWRDGKLIFRDRPIGDVIEEMNRYSTQKLVLGDDPRVREMRVSGVFNTGRASSFVTVLEYMHPVEARRTGADELTLVWQE